MSHGLQIYSASGALRISITTRITRLLYTQHIDKNSSGSVTLPKFDPSKGIAMIMPKGVPSSLVAFIPHDINISGTTISWQLHNPNWVSQPLADRYDGQLLVFMYK